MAPPLTHITLDPAHRPPLLRDEPAHHAPLAPTRTHFHPPKDTPSPSPSPAPAPASSFTPSSTLTLAPPSASSASSHGSVFFVGTATTVISWAGITILTDPNFLHAGDHVHLGPGVGATRLTNPAVELAALPPVDVVLLSHYHEDHFDRDVERRLGRDVPIVTTPHARACLADGREEGDAFRRVYGVDAFESVVLDVGGGGGGGGARDMVKITGMPGKHVPPGPAGAVGALNDVLGAVPPTNGWMVELGYVWEEGGDGEDEGGDDGEDGGGHENKNEGAHESQNAPSSPSASSSPSGYRIYISGDTLFVDELRAIPTWLGPRRRVDLMLVHLGGTTIPGPRLPLVMVTMDAAQGVALMRLVDPDATVPVHYDDYDVFASPLRDFKDAVNAAGWRDRVVYVDRGEEYRFRVREKGAEEGGRGAGGAGKGMEVAV